MATAQATRNAVTLQGSAAIISEYMGMILVQKKSTAKFTLHSTSIDYAINSILFQRGIYPAKTFAHHEKYGVNILMSTDPYVQNKLESDLKDIEGMSLCYSIK